MTLQPPRSTLFPYPPLFRSVERAVAVAAAIKTHRPALHVERAVVVECRANGGAARAPALLEAARVVDRRRTPEVAQEAGVPRHIERPCVVEHRSLSAPQIAPA